MREPSSAYLSTTFAAVHRRMENLPQPATMSDYAGQRQVWERVGEVVDKHAKMWTDLAQDLHDHPELAFEEHRSVKVLIDALTQLGFNPTVGAHGVETAGRAEFVGPGYQPGKHPTIAVMSEYDALPGIGHACGHNLIAAAGAAAFVAASELLAGAACKIVWLGTPAEEGHTGKEYMIRGGMLDGIDAAVMIHPFSYDIASHIWIGRRNVHATFRGISSHASSQPFMGRNALDAASLAYQGLGLLRQQMPPSDRLHAVISEGGQRPSVIPDQAALDIYVRSTEVDTLLDLSSRVQDVLDGAALMAGVDVSVEWDTHPMSLPVRNNQELAARWAKTQSRLGRHALPGGIVPETLAASTDFGNVSQLVPGLHPMVKIAPEGVSLHTREFATWAASESGAQGMLDAAKGLAQVIVDLVLDEALLQRAKDEFAETGGPRSVEEMLAQEKES